MSKSLTRQHVMDLLAAAGFDRGITNPPELAQDGYAVISDPPRNGSILVNWWPARAGLPGERAERAGWLERYAAALAAAGYVTRPAWRGDAEALGLSPDYLIVTAKDSTEGE